MQVNSRVAENKGTKVLDITATSERQSLSMKTKKQLTVFPLRFETKTQREIIRKAATAEGRSMNNYILRTLVERAAADLRRHADAAIDQLA